MDKNKLILWLFILSILGVIFVNSANYDWFYNPYTGKQDRSLSINQTNMTMQCLILNNSKICDWDAVNQSGGGGTSFNPTTIDYVNTSMLQNNSIVRASWTNVTYDGELNTNYYNKTEIQNETLIRVTNTSWLNLWYNTLSYFTNSNFSNNIALLSNITYANNLTNHWTTNNFTVNNISNWVTNTRLDSNYYNKTQTDGKYLNMNQSNTGNFSVTGNITLNGLHIDKINSTHWKIWG